MLKLKPGTIWPGPAKIEVTGEQIREIATGPMTYEQVEEEYGEEVAIEVGIARDPDTQEWTEEDFARARLAAEVMPQLVERWRREQVRKKALA